MRNWYFLLISVAAAAQAAPPQRVEIAYEVTRNGAALAEVVERLEHDGRSYRLTESWKGKGAWALRGEIRRSSRGAVGADGLRPHEFSDERSGRAPARARFDWSAKTLTLEHKGAPQTIALPANPHDRLSFLFDFAFEPPGAQPVRFSVADGRGVSDYVLQVAGHERVKTPAGEFDALRLVRRKAKADDRTSEFWLAAGRGFLPVRILVVEKGGTRIDQVATRISFQ